MKLNIGAGNTKIKGYTGIDIWKGEGVDIICDITKSKLPFPDSSVDHIIMSHVIEHIPEKYQPYLLDEFWRILKPGAELFFAYPEFKVIADHYIQNHRGMRDYWKMTIYGRQSSPGDFHVTLMNTDYFISVLEDHGFRLHKYEYQKGCDFNMLLTVSKVQKPTQREDLLAREIFNDQR